MGGLMDLAGRIARGELTVDEGLHDMAERLRPRAGEAPEHAEGPRAQADDS